MRRTCSRIPYVLRLTEVSGGEGRFMVAPGKRVEEARSDADHCGIHSVFLFKSGGAMWKYQS